MAFHFPSLKVYITGLAVSLMVLGIVYLLNNGLNIVTLSPLAALITGLLAGHFIGSVFSAQPDGLASEFQRGLQSNDNIQTIYVGNLPFKATRYQLRELFRPYGKVHSVRIMIDKTTRKPRGYGFVEMPHDDAAEAIASLDGVSFIGRSLKISEANERA